MKPPMLRNLRAVVLSGTLLSAAGVLAQTPQVPSIPPAMPTLPSLPGLPRQGGTGIPPLALPCGQNPRNLTALEQIQNGVTISEIVQQEVRAMACKVDPAVVEVIASGFGVAPGQEYDTVATATPGPSIGSGVIVSADGYIMTNRHVIKGAPKITIVLRVSGKPDEQISAEIKGQDERTDLALLKIEKTGLTFLEISRQSVQQGDTVYAFGSPHGVPNSMTKGIISAPTRQVDEKDPLDYIQTDAAINPGNSGGALVDLRGQLVGINTFILSGSGGNQGLNFAVPSDVVSYIYGQLRTNGYVIRGDIGIHTRNLSPDFIRAMKIPVQVGVYVEDVDPGGPADTAGVKIGDIVSGYDNVQFDSRRPDSALDLNRGISRKPKGSTIRLEVLRNGSSTPKILSVVVSQLSQETSDDLPQLSTDLIIDQLGIYGIPLTPSSAAARRLRFPQGVVVAAKVQAIITSDLQVGDVIHEINGDPVSTNDDLRQALDNAERGEPIALRVERDKKIWTMLITAN